MEGLGADSGAIGTHRPSAYVSTFDDTIDFALGSNGNLWTDAERSVLESCRSHTLSEGARLILSRLSLRRPKWIKSNSISHYVPYHMQNNPEAVSDFHKSLDALDKGLFVEYLTAKTTFETTFEVVQACFTLDDLTILYKRLTTSKNATNGNNKPLNKDALLEAINVAVRTQKTLFGQPLHHKFAQTVVETLKDLTSAPAMARFRSSYPPGSGGVNNKHNGGPLRILRINPTVLHLLRRCQRLYQVSHSNDSLGTLRKIFVNRMYDLRRFPVTPATTAIPAAPPPAAAVQIATSTTTPREPQRPTTLPSPPRASPLSCSR